ncbi:MAG: hypothetical protein ACN0LA_03140 [Candidatus Longimicrobiales bacterium M2_2A_002]
MVSIKRWSAALLMLGLAVPGLAAQEAPRDTTPEAVPDTTVQDTAAQDTAAQDTMAADTAVAAAPEYPIAPGRYTFIPGESEAIREKASEAVSHMFFAIRGIARRRLEGANKPIDRIIFDYRGDTILVSLREDESVYMATMSGDTIPYTREDGEVIQVTAETEPGMIDMYFIAEDGMKEMIFRLRENGRLAVESITYSDKLEEPFRYTWVYRAEDGA